jgi:hypothetical protein
MIQVFRCVASSVAVAGTVTGPVCAMSTTRRGPSKLLMTLPA